VEPSCAVGQLNTAVQSERSTSAVQLKGSIQLLNLNS
jgi:hypothetical protein